MDIKLIILVIISSVCAVHFDPSSLPPANVANVFHESGKTFVSPSTTNLVPSTALLPPPNPVNAFGFVAHNSNNAQKLVRTHSFQPVSHGFHSSVSAVHPHTTEHEHERMNDAHIINNIHASVSVSLPNDDVHVRFTDHSNNFEYNVPLTTTTAPHTTQFESSPHIHSTYDVPVEKTPAIHSTYGVPELVDAPVHVLSEEELNSLPVFQNDKFLSPVVRHTHTPTHAHLPRQSSSIHSTTRIIENFIDANNQYSLSDGTKVSEQGKLISTVYGRDHVIAKMGEYEYVTPEGKQVKVKWVADDKGFRVLNI